MIICPKPFWCHFGIGTAKIKALLLLTMPKLLHEQPGYVVIDKFKLPDGTSNEQSLRKSAKAYLESKGLLSKYGINMSSAFCKVHTDCSPRFHFRFRPANTCFSPRFSALQQHFSPRCSALQTYFLPRFSYRFSPTFPAKARVI